MKKPNDIKRPNTHSGKETRDRKRNQKYLWVSKPIIEVPVHSDDCDIHKPEQYDPEIRGTYKLPCSCNTKVKQRIALPVGKQYWNLNKKKNNKHERTKDSQRNPEG